jgi:hypothetical protein
MVYLLYTEETGIRRDPKSRFFIYGGMFFPIDTLPDVHTLVQRSRDDNGFREGDELRFGIKHRPQHIPKEQHAAARRSVLDGCRQLGVRIISTIVLPGVAKSRSMGELVGWGANSVLGAFEGFLEEEDAAGICTFDRLPFTQPYKFLTTKFRSGASLDDGTTRPLDRVQLVSLSCAGASHVASAVDIVIGYLKYCLNEKEPSETCRAMLPGILGMMWHKREGDTVQLRGYGLQFSPSGVKIPAYQQQYDELTYRLAAILKEGS